MIKIKVSDLMGKHKLNAKQLSDITGIRPPTISALYHETSKRIDIDMMDALCKAFNCNVGDIFEFVDEPKSNKKTN